MTLIDRAVIPAAGWGTRCLPATKETPKEMIPVIDTPPLLYVVNEAIDSGLEFIHIVTSRNKHSAEDFFRRNHELEDVLARKGMLKERDMVEKIGSLDERNIRFVTQNEQKGLGHSIYCAMKKHDSLKERPFAVLLGDDIVVSKKPCTKQLMEVYDKYRGSVIAVQEVADENVSKYGIIDGEVISNGRNGHRIYKVNNMVEKPLIDPPSNMAIIGRYVIEPQIYSILREMVDQYSVTDRMDSTARTLRSSEKWEKRKGTATFRRGEKRIGGKVVLPAVERTRKMLEPPIYHEIQLTEAINQLPKEYKTRNFAYEFEGTRYDLGDKFDFWRAGTELGLKRDDIGPQIRKYLSELKL